MPGQRVNELTLDTRFYWNLTRHIYRYSHRGDLDDLYNGLHTVNEGQDQHCVFAALAK